MPAVVASDLIAQALRLAGITASGEVPDANETRDALAVLNDLIESWSTEGLTIPATFDQTFPVTAGQATYTVGPSGTWAGTRPVDISSAFARFSGVDYFIEITHDSDRFNAISLKSQQSITPMIMLWNGTFPNATVNLWPTPAQTGVQITLTAPQPHAAVADVATTISLPPGYSKALRYCLACELAPEYGVALSPAIVETAKAAKGAIKRANSDPPELQIDEAIVGSGGSALAQFLSGR